MTKLTIISALLLASSSAVAQDAPAAASLPAVSFSTVSGAAARDDVELATHGRVIKHHGYYFAPTFGVTTLNHDVAPVIGLRSAWLANHSFGVGFAGSIFANELDEKADFAGRVAGGYGGLLLQYVIGSSHLLHGFVDTTIGGGGMCVQSVPAGRSEADDCDTYSFFLVEPTANMEFNISRNIRLSVGAGYRVALGDDDSPLSNRELSGFVGKTSVEFGRF